MSYAIALPEVSEVIRVLAADATRMNSQLLAAALERDRHHHAAERMIAVAAPPEYLERKVELGGRVQRHVAVRAVQASEPFFTLASFVARRLVPGCREATWFALG